MNNLSEIISIEESISKKEAIIKPIQEELDVLVKNHNKLITTFLESVMVKGKKYMTSGNHAFKWICYNSFTKDNFGDSFYCEFRNNIRKSIIFKEYLKPDELYEVFINTDYYKELVRESGIKSILDDK